MYLRDLKPCCDRFHEECGVFGIYSDEKRDVANTVYFGLYALQHRGQESAGIAVAHDNKITCFRDMGLVPEVFTEQRLKGFPEGDIAIGHVRYSTTGSSTAFNAKPFVFSGKVGRMAIAHNGNIVNSKALREKLISENIVFQTATDAEVIAALINKYIENDILGAIVKAGDELIGSYAFVIMTSNKLIAVRDPSGIRPLCLGIYRGEYIVASESCALDAVDAEFIRDLEPGEVLCIDFKGLESRFLNNRGSALCIFEHVYFARPDSFLDGCSVYEARKEAGRILAKKHPVKADIVSGVPDSAVVAARGYSEVTGIPYVEALNKNRYVGRAFIQPSQGMRESSVGIKMNAIKANVKGKSVVLIDDSIVRGTTSKKIISILRAAGAKEVHLRICSPIIRHPCFLGIDMQTHSQLVGHKRSVKEVCDYIGADSLEYLEVDELLETVKGSRIGFCTGCFTGKYPVEFDIKDIDKEKFEE